MPSATLRSLAFGLILVMLLSACERAGVASLRIERLAISPAARIAVPESWTAAYEAALVAIGGAGAVTTTADPETAVAAVGAGTARYALVPEQSARGLIQRPVEAVPVALIVPLTFPVERLTREQATAIALGQVANWTAVGGPSRPLRAVAGPGAAGAAARVFGGAVAATLVSGSASLPAGTVRIDTSEPVLGEKALQIDGVLPSDAGYPLADRRLLAGRVGDEAALDTVAATLRAQIERNRTGTVVLDAVGDIMLGRSVGRNVAERGASFPFDAIHPVISGSDLRFGNLELPLTERGTPARKDYVFRAPPSSVAVLQAGGINVVSVANNHLVDYGGDGLSDTLAALERAGIAHAGAGATPEQARAPALLTVKGIRIAVLAYVNVPNDSVSGFVAESMAAAPGRPGVAWGTVEAVRRDVAAAKGKADVVVVSLHSGFEYTAAPNAIQRDLAHAAIDAGAALVLGGHPHVLQGLELYKNAPIIYSLGNFIFDLDDDDRRQPGLPSVLTVVFRVTLDTHGVRNVRFLPAQIDPRDARPVPATGAAAAAVFERLYRLTDALATGS